MRERPLSPHLQIYRWTLTMAMSILHRATGVALSVGTVMIAWMLIAAASGPDAFSQFEDFTKSMFGQLLLLGWTVSLFYHLFNGIRHMCWDVGIGFEIETARKSGLSVLFWTIVVTDAIWNYPTGSGYVNGALLITSAVLIVVIVFVWMKAAVCRLLRSHK